MRLRLALLAITVAAALNPDRLDASAVIFTDSRAFEAAVGSHEVLTFDAPRPCVIGDNPGLCRVDYGSVVFDFESGDPVITSPAVIVWEHSATMHFPTPQRAAGFDFSALSDNPITVHIGTTSPTFGSPTIHL